MSLTTTAFITGTLDPQALFTAGVHALLASSRLRDDPAPEDVIVEHATKGQIPSWIDASDVTDANRDYFTSKESMVYSREGQGLPAIVRVRFDPDGPIAAEDPEIQSPQHDMRLSWNTANGYRVTDFGQFDANALHAKALIELRRLLPDTVTIAWRDETTGDVYDVLDQVALERFARCPLPAVA